MLLFSLPHVLYVPQTPRVPSLLVQKFQRHFSLSHCSDWISETKLTTSNPKRSFKLLPDKGKLNNNGDTM